MTGISLLNGGTKPLVEETLMRLTNVSGRLTESTKRMLLSFIADICSMFGVFSASDTFILELNAPYVLFGTRA